MQSYSESHSQLVVVVQSYSESHSQLVVVVQSYSESHIKACPKDGQLFETQISLLKGQ